MSTSGSDDELLDSLDSLELEDELLLDELDDDELLDELLLLDELDELLLLELDEDELLLELELLELEDEGLLLLDSLEPLESLELEDELTPSSSGENICSGAIDVLAFEAPVFLEINDETLAALTTLVFGIFCPFIYPQHSKLLMDNL